MSGRYDWAASLAACDTPVRCRAWENADDGYDLWRAKQTVRLEQCIAYRNGYNLWNDPAYQGDGNGFKLGGAKVAGRHVIVGCIAAGHPAAGFTQNNNPGTPPHSTVFAPNSCGLILLFPGGRQGLTFRTVLPHDAHPVNRVASRRLRLPLIAALCAPACLLAQSAVVSFNANASVHDPSIYWTGSDYYVFGSHLASARTTDLMAWTQLSTTPVVGNPVVNDPATTFAEALAWAGATNYWAPDVYRLPDGRYAFYYCVTAGDTPRSALGYATATSVGGPYANANVFLKSGMWGAVSPDGTIYDATRHPNAIDPDVFADKNGAPWMVYGSYSGGIFALRLNAADGLPVAGQGYGKKLIGGNHVRIEGPCVLYNPTTGYYYLFLSFGGLESTGGYQVRVGRSLNPDGPYNDPAGNNLTTVAGPVGSFFDDTAIAPYGAKILGNYQFLHVAGEPRTTSRGYLSPGHCSVHRDPATGYYYLVFHTRFVGSGEAHGVRVHRLHFNRDGWPVVAPHRYAGETTATFAAAAELAGTYKLINLGKDISSTVRESALATLAADGTVSGAEAGTWSLSAGNLATLTLSGATYRGVFLRQWDDDNKTWVRAFTTLSGTGVSVWGSEVAPVNVAPVFPGQGVGAAFVDQTYTRVVAASDPDFAQSLTYALVSAPLGASIDAATGQVSWTPLLAHVGGTHRFTVRATDNGFTPASTTTNFDVSVVSATVVQRTALEFTAAAASGIADSLGRFTGFTHRLPGTGTSVPANDPLLSLNTSGTGSLSLTSTQADYNGGAGLATNRSVGLALSSLGFTGSQDFAVTVEFRALPTLGSVDQVGLFVGASGTTLTRAGAIRFGATPEGYATHTQAGADVAGRFGGTHLTPSDGMSVTIQRTGGVWRHFVDGVEWNPSVSGVKSEASFLNGFTDLTVGVFAITPFNTTQRTVQIESFTALVDTGRTSLETWRIQNFGTSASLGNAADAADPDGDGLPNLIEYGLGGSPLAPTRHPAPSLAATPAGARLSLTFARIADPALRYAVEGADSPAGPFTELWSSTGVDNTGGPVTIQDTVDTAPTLTPARYLRLVVTR